MTEDNKSWEKWMMYLRNGGESEVSAEEQVIKKVDHIGNKAKKLVGLKEGKYLDQFPKKLEKFTIISFQKKYIEASEQKDLLLKIKDY